MSGSWYTSYLRVCNMYSECYVSSAERDSKLNHDKLL
jgi:hypothetical protein